MLLRGQYFDFPYPVCISRLCVLCSFETIISMPVTYLCLYLLDNMYSCYTLGTCPDIVFKTAAIATCRIASPPFYQCNLIRYIMKNGFCYGKAKNCVIGKPGPEVEQFKIYD